MSRQGSRDSFAWLRVVPGHGVRIGEAEALRLTLSVSVQQSLASQRVLQATTKEPTGSFSVEAVSGHGDIPRGRSWEGSKRLRESDSGQSFSRGGGLTAYARRAFRVRRAPSAVFL